jgi:cytochrome P450
MTSVIDDPTAPKIDLMSAASFANGHPFDQYEWLRRNHPVFWYPVPPVGPGSPPPGHSRDGFWAVTSYDGVHTVARDNATFSSQGYVGALDYQLPAEMGLGNFIALDDPVHASIRKVISSRFTPRAVRSQEDRFASIARDIVNEMCELGECDFVPSVAGKMASYVGADLLGIPRQDAVALYHFVEVQHATGGGHTAEELEEAFLGELAYCDQVWRQKSEQPGDDVATELASGSVNGNPVDQGTFMANFSLLIHGSSDTTRNLIAGGLLALLEHPDQMQKLRADLDTLMPSAVEEMLRWVSPVVWVPRIATRDTVLCGQPIKKGDMAVIWYGAANRDPSKFPEPDRFDISRSPNEHIAFGFAAHFCLGVHVGRLQVRSVLKELLRRLPDISLAGPVKWLDGTLTSGPAQMPIRYSPTARAQ